MGETINTESTSIDILKRKPMKLNVPMSKLNGLQHLDAVSVKQNMHCCMHAHIGLNLVVCCGNKLEGFTNEQNTA